MNCGQKHMVIVSEKLYSSNCPWVILQSNHENALKAIKRPSVVLLYY